MHSSSVIIAVLNARYSHSALGVRYLLANMGSLRSRTMLKEFLIQDDLLRVAEEILSENPKIVALSISIWNASPTARLIALLKRINPELRIIIGGPEVRWAEKPMYGADVLVRGEGEHVFPDICTRLLNGGDVPAIVDGGLPKLDTLKLPYDEYSDEDLKQRIIYVESSRGCPFSCEFCLSSRELKIRNFNLDRLLPAFDRLINRGCRGFKFIDRTFNLDIDSCIRILDFFYERWPREKSGELVSPAASRQAALGRDRGESFFLHFEVVPDRFDERLVKSLSRFPVGGIQLEMGVQTLNPEIGSLISRKVDSELTARNLKLIKGRTGVHVHADLIIGLPGEDETGFAESFDSLRSMHPDEIQIGILKLLPGAPIARHIDEYKLVFNPQPPYDILSSSVISFPRMQQLKRLAKYYDIFVNSGKFTVAMELIMDSGGCGTSAFFSFNNFSDWLYDTTGQDHGISQPRQYSFVLDFLTLRMGLNPEDTGKTLAQDFLKLGIERYLPECLRPFL
ncbi:MAG: DUF4080 domain-containing protein [Spirochaetaceae bacterium]|nr:DUF4080 domain-containing protein [Spirochaetaceae bacterium]